MLGGSLRFHQARKRRVDFPEFLARLRESLRLLRLASSAGVDAGRTRRIRLRIKHQEARQPEDPRETLHFSNLTLLGELRHGDCRREDPVTSGTTMAHETTPDEEAWAKQFDVTREQIREAIQRVGREKADVEMYLKGSHSSTDGELADQAGS